jgi:hypothetical protein
MSEWIELLAETTECYRTRIIMRPGWRFRGIVYVACNENLLGLAMFTGE